MAVITGLKYAEQLLQNAASATGNGNAFDVQNYGVLVLQTSGTFTATITFEGSVDNTTFVGIPGINAGDGNSALTTTATDVVFRFDVSGLSHFRARISSYTSGNVTVRARALPLPAGNQTLATGSGGVLALIGARNQTDGLANTTIGTLEDTSGSNVELIVAPYLFNGDTWDRARSADLTSLEVASTLTARNSIGAALVEKGSRWMVIHTPGAGTQATASIAAEASVRHVCDTISFSAGSSTAPTATAATVELRDGATGAGTIIWQFQVVFGASATQHVTHSIGGLNLVGTTNTAMTLEFSAGVANVLESVSISGYNVA